MPRVAGVANVPRRSDNFRPHDARDHAVLHLRRSPCFAVTIAFGVVYNSARIALSERGRELASLRVLGFTRGEIAYILLGELALLTLLAIPLGFVLGGWSCADYMASCRHELFRVPLVLAPQTYAFAALRGAASRRCFRPAGAAPPRPARPGGGAEDAGMKSS